MKNPISKMAVPILCLFAIATVANLPARAQSAAEKTFKAKCVACHGADGAGTETGKKLGTHDFRSTDVQKMSDADLVNEISQGKNKMPGYGKSLKPDEIKDLAAYVAELSKKS